ncbi:VWA domain-containing protein [Streptomyces sp. NBC_00670]|uniref:VWA domain-containing protein n=1 Tax=Streptomyces sp. NBC_00670 TaxID=2975804 RepID=UPI002E2F1BFF|nr:VWA domain-containing protein [Streptomyces sp. NBC_00670]
MGLLTLLRNAFGRSRKGRKDGTESVVTAEPERLPAQETAPVAAPEEPAPAPAPKVPSPAAEPTPAPKPTAHVPDPRQESGESRDEHDLVSAAFDNVTVPKPTRPADETEPAPEPKPEPVVTEEPEPVAAEEPEPVAAEEPKAAEALEPELEPAPEPEPTTAPAPTPEPEPAAANDEEPPQGPPAPDDETATGGAGGKTNEAEGEAEAAKRNPATPASRIRTTAPALSTAYKAAGNALRRHDLTGTRAKVHLVLDRSASMRPYYKDGSAQALGEQTLALAAHLDPEATVHVTFFSTELDGTGELTLAAHENKIDELHAGLGRMGRTSYHAAVEAVLARHAEEPAGTPALVIFQTDGAPDAKTPATQALTDAAANHPEVFFSFVAFGEHENKAFDYLRKLKTENTSFFHAGPTPRELTDKELYEGVLATWRP